MKGNAKILIVEDQMPPASLMVNILARIGCDVAVCTGKKAMVLADVKLPEANGFKICSELNENHVTCNTPVIFILVSPCELYIIPTEFIARESVALMDIYLAPFFTRRVSEFLKWARKFEQRTEISFNQGHE